MSGLLSTVVVVAAVTFYAKVQPSEVPEPEFILMEEILTA